ncbi:MAG: hypothetical protein AB199_02635 [Parcubacteria bacterium C7867-004]|nr:MAG: hypothetical protein AB199_02635 [Parcubacteria bacterium C7867-004]
MNISQKAMRGLASASMALSLAACQTTMRPPPPVTDQGKLGGSYLTGVFPGLKATATTPAVAGDLYGPDQFRQMQELDYACHKQLDPYIPGIASEIVIPTARGAVIGGTGTAIAYTTAYTGVSFSQFLKLGGILNAAGQFDARIDRYQLAIRYVQYACMVGFVARAQQRGQLKGVVIIPWAGSGPAKQMSMPTTTVGKATNEPPSAPGAAAPLPAVLP